jgi:hypothetical protein
MVKNIRARLRQLLRRAEARMKAGHFDAAKRFDVLLGVRMPKRLMNELRARPAALDRSAADVARRFIVPGLGSTRKSRGVA